MSEKTSAEIIEKMQAKEKPQTFEDGIKEGRRQMKAEVQQRLYKIIKEVMGKVLSE